MKGRWLVGWSHRIRGHRIRFHTSCIGSVSGDLIEWGRLDDVARCSCGHRWVRRCTNPLFDEWEWI